MRVRTSTMAGAFAAAFLLPALVVAAGTGPDGGQGDGPTVEQVYEPFGVLLERYVVEKDLEGGGLVSAFRYRQAHSDPETFDLLEAQRERLRRFDTGRLQEKYEAIAFWLNAYNFFMIAHILAEPTAGGSDWIDGVRDYGTLFRPYRVFSLEIFDVGGEKLSLDGIEKGILLGDEYKARGWKEARVHFAVNCASVGCPPIRRQLYTRRNADSLLTENTRRALKTERHMRLDGTTLHLSRLFDWYASDYEEEAGSVRAWLKKYTDRRLHGRIDDARRIRYIRYDWSLNEPANFPELQGGR